jgi:hypothetical protein
VSHICNLAYEPAAAKVSGESGDHRMVNTLPCKVIGVRSRHETLAEKTYDTQVLTCDHGNLSAGIILFLYVPDLYRLVHSSRGNTAAHVRVDM